MVNSVPVVDSPPIAGAQRSAAAPALGKDDFMRLLLASLQHQDPLDPLEPTDFSAQLAQFSSLEQLMQINERLGSQNPAATPPDRLSLVGLIGKEVSVRSSRVEVEDNRASVLSYDLERPGVVTLKVRTAAGNTVADLVLGVKSAGTHELRLDEIAALADLGDGTYEVELAVSTGDGTSAAVVTRAADRVIGVALGEEPRLLLAGGGSVGIEGIVEVREPAED